jgi:predicted amidophosphoribosyltransferase
MSKCWNCDNETDYPGEVCMICGVELYIPVRFTLCPKCEAEIPSSSLRCAFCMELLIDRDEAFAAITDGQARKPDAYCSSQQS